MLFLLRARYVHMVSSKSQSFPRNFIKITYAPIDSYQIKTMTHKLSMPQKMFRTLGIGPKPKKEYAVYLDERNKIQILIEFS